jgi:hypothetical protein
VHTFTNPGKSPGHMFPQGPPTAPTFVAPRGDDAWGRDAIYPRWGWGNVWCGDALFRLECLHGKLAGDARASAGTWRGGEGEGLVVRRVSVNAQTDCLRWPVWAGQRLKFSFWTRKAGPVGTGLVLRVWYVRAKTLTTINLTCISITYKSLCAKHFLR